MGDLFSSWSYPPYIEQASTNSHTHTACIIRKFRYYSIIDLEHFVMGFTGRVNLERRISTPSNSSTFDPFLLLQEKDLLINLSCPRAWYLPEAYIYRRVLFVSWNRQNVPRRISTDGLTDRKPLDVNSNGMKKGSNSTWFWLTAAGLSAIKHYMPYRTMSF